MRKHTQSNTTTTQHTPCKAKPHNTTQHTNATTQGTMQSNATHAHHHQTQDKDGKHKPSTTRATLGIELSDATIVPQGDVAADMPRSVDELILMPGNAAETATPEGISARYWSTGKTEG
uniref:Uncharacterized protein n=1 Tax=Eutreptiella gymnastica TaxID=73025 RepID=A0A6T2HFE9_9EUGL